MDDIFSQSSRFVTRRRKSYTALFKLRVIEYASTGNMKRASYAEVCGWISQTWTSVTNECVKHGFKKALYETGKEEAGDAEDERKIITSAFLILLVLSGYFMIDKIIFIL
ncbi:hypothetical protein HZS_3339 [Henneguya salminicola]|nr:hypothetical protein HZS_3339 [Henneguya salminicola]